MINIAIFNGAAGHLKLAARSNIDTAAISRLSFLCTTAANLTTAHDEGTCCIDTATRFPYRTAQIDCAAFHHKGTA